MRWHIVPMAASEHRRALFKSFLKASCFTELCRWKGSSNTLPPKPNAHSLPFMPLYLAQYCIVKPRGNYSLILDSIFFFFFCGQKSSPTIHSSKHGVCTHTVLYFARPIISENQEPVALKTVWRKWTLWMFPNWLSWLI